MPTYDYRRADGTKFEVTQRITDKPLETCPTTGQTVTRLIGGGVGVIFKGSGFYQTDYVRKDKGTDREPKSTSAVAKDTKPVAKEKKPEKKAAAKSQDK